MATRERTRAARDWSTEEAWWQDNYRSRPYYEEGKDFEHYRPAYRYGYETYPGYGGKTWEEAEPELRTGWKSWEGRAERAWEDVKDAVRDVWDHLRGNEHDEHGTRH